MVVGSTDANGDSEGGVMQDMSGESGWHGDGNGGWKYTDENGESEGWVRQDMSGEIG